MSAAAPRPLRTATAQAPARPTQQPGSLSAALKKALITLLGGRGKVPTSVVELGSWAERLYNEVHGAAGGDVPSDMISRSDLYAYLVTHSESGISKKTVDQLFSKVDENGDGWLDRDEFVGVLQRCHAMLTEHLSWDDPAVQRIPDVHVVAGSSGHNTRSGTRAFRVAVVRRASMRRLWQTFKDMDADGDGYLQLPEFKKYIRRKQPHVVSMSTSMFKTLDGNKDGRVSFQELLHKLYPAASDSDVLLMMRMARPSETQATAKRVDPEVLADVRNIFKIFDTSGDGALDLEEFTAALGLLGFGEEEAGRVFRQVDTDGAGDVSLEEFEAWFIEGHKEQAKEQARAMRNADRDSDLEEG